MLPAAVHAQLHGFVVRLGVDTVAIESCARNDDQLEGTLLRRLPEPMLIRFTFSLSASDDVTAFEQPLSIPDSSPIAEERFRILVAGDDHLFRWDRSAYGVKIEAK